MAVCKSAPACRMIRRAGGGRQTRSEALPPVPDKRLWATDEVRAFEAGVRWFLAVSRAA